MKQPESKIVKKIRIYLEGEGAWVFKVHGGDNPFQAVGIPDLLCCWRRMFIALEVKVPGEKPSPRQLLVMERIVEAGGIAEVVESMAGVKNIIKRLSCVSEGDLQYIAGFFDGEGSCSIATANGYAYPRIAIYQSDREVLEWMREVLGMGRIVERSPRERTGRPKQTKPRYVLSINQVAQVRLFIELIRPYSRLAHREVQFAKAYPLARYAHRRSGTTR